MIVAIDGPAGSGKTTVAKILAKKLGFSSLDTGATYRALTLKAIESNCNLKDTAMLCKLAKNLSIKIDGSRLYLDNRDVTEAIRQPIINQNISDVVSSPEIRKIMVDLQRKIVKNKNFVVEGRDITTVVFPNAEFKFYLDAKFEVRVKRRAKEYFVKKINITEEEVKKDLERRDRADRERKVGALKLSPDAIYLDTTNLSLKEVLKTIIYHMKLKCKNLKIK